MVHSKRTPCLEIEEETQTCILRLRSPDGTNCLARTCLADLTQAIHELAQEPKPLIITGNDRFFSAGAALREISELDAISALELSYRGQILMNAIERFPAPTIAAISGYCMGGGLDLALACRSRIAAPGAVFGHRGAALGLVTGWGGTQRLPRLVGKSRALQMLSAAESISAQDALNFGLIDAIAENPVAESICRLLAMAGKG